MSHPVSYPLCPRCQIPLVRYDSATIEESTAKRIVALVLICRPCSVLWTAMQTITVVIGEIAVKSSVANVLYPARERKG